LSNDGSLFVKQHGHYTIGFVHGIDFNRKTARTVVLAGTSRVEVQTLSSRQESSQAWRCRLLVISADDALRGSAEAVSELTGYNIQRIRWRTSEILHNFFMFDRVFL
jgi:hypothetical protein